MTRGLTRTQSALLGVVVTASLAAAGWLVYRIAARGGLGREYVEYWTAYYDVSGIDVGTPISIRGLDAGRVGEVEVPDISDPDANYVRVRLDVLADFQPRLREGATATVRGTGIMSKTYIDLEPGDPASPPLVGNRVKGEYEASLTSLAADGRRLMAKLESVADETQSMLKQVRESEGTLTKLIADDSLYRDLKGLAGDVKRLTANTDAAVKGLTERTNQQLDKVRNTVEEAEGAIDTIKRDAEAIKKLPIIRSYIEDPIAAVERPRYDKKVRWFTPDDLFVKGQAKLTESGKGLLRSEARRLMAKGHRVRGSAVTVCVFGDPNDDSMTSKQSHRLTQRRAEVIVDFLEDHKVHKIAWVIWRDVEAFGFGKSPLPIKEKKPAPRAHVRVTLFLPR